MIDYATRVRFHNGCCRLYNNANNASYAQMGAIGKTCLTLPNFTDLGGIPSRLISLDDDERDLCRVDNYLRNGYVSNYRIWLIFRVRVENAPIVDAHGKIQTNQRNFQGRVNKLPWTAL